MRPLADTINALDDDALEGLGAHLLTYVTPDRVNRLDDVLARRTRHLTVVLENVYHSHNASAVLRSCECFGLQDLHAIENPNRFEVHRAITQGAAKWVTLYRYRGTEGTSRCLRRLRDSGHRIVAMSLDPGSVPVSELPIDAPLALCFGAEDPGLTERTRAMADVSARIPMAGFTQSLNLSVSAGIALERLGARIRASEHEWRLDSGERKRLRVLWLAQSIHAGRAIVQRYLNSAAD